MAIDHCNQPSRARATFRSQSCSTNFPRRAFSGLGHFRAALATAVGVGGLLAWTSSTIAGQGPQTQPTEQIRSGGVAVQVQEEPKLMQGPFESGRVRLPVLPGELKPPVSVPQPSPKVQQDFGRFIERAIDPENTLEMIEGRTRVLVLKDVPKRVQIEDEKIATYLLVSERELSVSAKKPGSTVLNLWFAEPGDPTKQRVLSYLVRVSQSPEATELQTERTQRQLDELKRRYKALEREINGAFPDSVIKLDLIGEMLVLSGQVKDSIESANILQVVQANAPKIVKETIRVDRIQLVAGAEQVAGQRGAQDAGSLRGLRDVLSAEQVNVVNLLRVPGEQQVALRVTVAEVNRSAARSIGLNFSVINDEGQLVFANFTGGLISATPGGGSTGTGQANIAAFLDNRQIPLAINALRRVNMARTLAEPTLTTMNGQQADFHAGGQFPVPVVTGFTSSGLQGVSFVPFGVQLRFTPYITDKDRIRLVLSAEVSVRDESLGTTIGTSTGVATSVSGINTRNFNTTVELREGQTLAVAGLIQNNFGADADRVPFFGDLPVIGRLFAFDRTTAGEQELVVLVTPELVHPLNPGELPPLPGSGVFEPDDLEFYLHAQLESACPPDYRSTVRTDLHRQKQHRRVEGRLIIGPQGYSDGR